ncbi:MAG: cupin domain-containing protein [Bryobacterales bacterium]|nr:cupin domain-containing protein [Bryobacterales bacterium]
MSLHSWEKIPLEQMNTRVSRKVLHGAQMTIAQIFLRAGGTVPEHHHPHEQTTMLQSGKLLFRMEGREYTLIAGSILNIPPHVPHQVEAIEDSVAIDVFSPARDDWQRGDDAYLRRG